MLICGGKGDKMTRMLERATAALTVLALGASVLTGCSGVQIPSGLSAAASNPTTTAVETTAAVMPSSAKASGNSTSETAKTSDSTFTADTVTAKKKALEGTSYSAGTTYLAESENQAALEVVLSELGVAENVYNADASRLVDCGGTDIWFICFGDDVTSVRVVLGDEEDGKELYKADNPGYIFIRCFSTGEIPSCTVLITSQKTGETKYHPFLIGGDIVLPGNNAVMNQSEDMNSFIDVPEETNNSDETEEEVP